MIYGIVIGVSSLPSGNTVKIPALFCLNRSPKEPDTKPRNLHGAENVWMRI
jgi:hypothetical protein